jgi:hypothetical protein
MRPRDIESTSQGMKEPRGALYRKRNSCQAGHSCRACDLLVHNPLPGLSPGVRSDVERGSATCCRIGLANVRVNGTLVLRKALISPDLPVYWSGVLRSFRYPLRSLHTFVWATSAFRGRLAALERHFEGKIVSGGCGKLVENRYYQTHKRPLAGPRQLDFGFLVNTLISLIYR